MITVRILTFFFLLGLSLFSFLLLTLIRLAVTLLLSSSSSLETLDVFFLDEWLSAGSSKEGPSAAFLFCDGLLDRPDSVLDLRVFSACNLSFSTSSIGSSSTDSLFFFFSISFDSLLLFLTSATFFFSSSTSFFTCILPCLTESLTSDSFSTSAFKLRNNGAATGSTGF